MKTFNTKEEAENFKNSWQGEGQLSNIKEGSKWYVTLPNPISLSLGKATKKQKIL